MQATDSLLHASVRRLSSSFSAWLNCETKSKKKIKNIAKI